MTALLFSCCAESEQSPELKPKASRSATSADGTPTNSFNVTPPYASAGSGGAAKTAASGGAAAASGGAASTRGGAASIATGGAASVATGGASGGAGASASSADVTASGGSASAPTNNDGSGSTPAAVAGATNSAAASPGSGGVSANPSEPQQGGAQAVDEPAVADCPSPTRARLKDGECVERIVEFPVATAPTSIAAGSDGMLWFDDGSGHQLVQLDPSGTVRARFALPAEESQRALLAGSGDVVLWYTDSTARTLSKVSSDLQATVYLLDFVPSALALAADGNMWLAEPGRAIHRLNVETAAIEGWDAAPSSNVIIGPDANAWFPSNYLLGRMTPAGERSEFPINGGYLDHLCAGPDGALWYADATLSQVGRIELNGMLGRTFDLPPASAPLRIVSGPDGALWFLEQGANKVGRIDVHGVISEYPIPSRDAIVRDITVGPDRSIWFTEFGSGKIGRLIPDVEVEK